MRACAWSNRGFAAAAGFFFAAEAVAVFLAGAACFGWNEPTRFSSAFEPVVELGDGLDQPLDPILDLLDALDRVVCELAGRELGERFSPGCELGDHGLLGHGCSFPQSSEKRPYPIDVRTIRVAPTARIASSGP